MSSLPNPCGRRVPSGELLPWLFPAQGYPSPSYTGSARALPGSPGSAAAWQSCSTAGHRGAGEGEGQPRRQGRVFTNCCTHLHSTQWTLKASAGAQQLSWHLPSPERDAHSFWSLHKDTWHACGHGMWPYRRMKQMNDSTEKSRKLQNLLLEHLQQDEQPHKCSMRRIQEKVCRVQLSDPG